MSRPDSLTTLLDELRDRQCRQWLAGKRVLVETYLQDHPNLRTDPENTLLLVYQEVLLRERLGETPELGEYRRRFPHLADRLGRLFAVHQAFESGEVFNSPSAEPNVKTTLPLEDEPRATLPNIPGYELLEELGRGGAGVVYKARQKGLDRLVALKMLLAGTHASTAELKRFRAEAEAQARVPHPHIVQIFEVNDCRVEGSGIPVQYLAMEFVGGGSLADYLGGVPQPPRQVAELIETLARAIHHAHQKGLVHRDLKPGNILLEETRSRGARTCVPKIADFGLAKRFEQDGAASTSGNLVGTPCYMAPEQAAGETRRIGPATDVYALGVILYEALTGRPPFLGETTLSTLLRIRHDEPIAPRRLQPKVPHDLETICLKCLRKEPAKRYSTAEALADDLRNYLDGRPILARPVTSAERLARWCRRNPLLAGAAAAVVLTVVTAFVLIADSRNQALALAEKNEGLRQTAEEQREHIAREHEFSTRLAQENEQLAEKERAQRLQAERDSALLAFQRALARCEVGEVPRGMLWLAHSLERAVQAKDADLERVIRLNLDGWGQKLQPLRGCVARDTGVQNLAVNPKDDSIVVAGRNRIIRLWNANLDQQLATLQDHTEPVNAVAFSPDGKWLVSGSSDTTALLWDMETKKPFGKPLEHAAKVNCVAFSSTGVVATGGTDGIVWLWSVEKQAKLRPLEHGGNVRTVAFSPDGSKLVTAGGNRRIMLWDVEKGEELRRIANKKGEISLLTTTVAAFHPDGETFLTGGFDGMVHQWNVETRQKMGPSLSHPANVHAAAYSRDGKYIVTGCADRVVRLWDARQGTPLGYPLTHDSLVTAVAFSANGQAVVTGTQNGPTRLWDVAAVFSEGAVLKHGEWVYAASFSPDSKLVVTAGRPPTSVQIWDTKTGDLQAKLASNHTLAIRSAVFHPQGQLLLTGGLDNVVRLSDRTDGKERRTFPGTNILNPLAIQRDGKFLAMRDETRTVQLWDVEKGEKHGEVMKHFGVVHCVAFSPDGKTLLSGSAKGAAGEAYLWNVETGQALRDPLALPATVVSVGFSQDGQTFFAGCQDGTVHFWDRASMKPRGRILQETGAVRCMALAPDGLTILTDTHQKAARLWDVATNQPLGPPLQHGNWVWVVAIRPDGKQLLTGGQDGMARLWPMPQPREGTVEHLRQWVQVGTGAELNKDDTMKVLDAATWQELRQGLQQEKAP